VFILDVKLILSSKFNLFCVFYLSDVCYMKMIFVTNKNCMKLW